MATVVIGVNEVSVLRHEIEIKKVGMFVGKELAEIMNYIEKNGVENIEDYVERIEGCVVTDTVISDEPDEGDIHYESWIIDAKK